jgi:hypothetical protein
VASNYAHTNDCRADIFIYPGLGYEVIIKKRASVYLNILSRYILSDPNKLKYFEIKNIQAGGRPAKVTDINPTLGSDIFWQVGINYLF